MEFRVGLAGGEHVLWAELTLLTAAMPEEWARPHALAWIAERFDREPNRVMIMPHFGSTNHELRKGGRY